MIKKVERMACSQLPQQWKLLVLNVSDAKQSKNMYVWTIMEIENKCLLPLNPEQSKL